MCYSRILPLLIVAFVSSPLGAVQIDGEKRVWHRVTITFDGPLTEEQATANPFTDYRLNVTFANGDRRFVVPGFFAADGDAAETSAAAGNKWRVHFCPNKPGKWTYRASFRAGKNIAVSLEPEAGRPAAFDGQQDEFDIAPSDKQGRDFRAHGRLNYVGRHYLQFAGSGDYFLKGGADSPENFLAYADFDGTTGQFRAHKGLRKGEASTKGLHRYEPHVQDWRRGDPTWKGDQGKGIIGALNYLAAKGMNSVYFLTMNVKGDGKDVWPWTAADVRDRFDGSKLDQWEVVLAHMDRLGIMLHVITQETENDQLLDGGQLGRERKLYYRELIARFGHHLAVVWNLGEENSNSNAQRKDFCRYIRALDPYDHPIVCHTFPGKYDEVYSPLLGFEHFEGPSLQTNATHQQTKRWLERSRQRGRPWVVCLDEIGPAHTGVKPDKVDPQHDEVRTDHLWGNLMAGGAGVEWYFGYKFAHNDLNCEDFRSRDKMWDQTRFALEFFRRHLPFHEMRSSDDLLSGADGHCFAKENEVYAVYLKKGGAAHLRLPAGRFDIRWYNPRRGGELQNGSVTSLNGPGNQALGRPPAEPGRDWAVLVRRAN